jgi:hypothetical protein
MFRLLATTAFLLSLIFISLSLVSIAIGNTQPPKPALAGLSICASGSPCWFGIDAENLPFEEADRLLTNLGYREVTEGYYEALDEAGLCDVYLDRVSSGPRVIAIYLYDCPDVVLGDAMIMPPMLLYTCSGRYHIALQRGLSIILLDYPSSLYESALFIVLSNSPSFEVGSWRGFRLRWNRMDGCPEGG